jgi:hypothetical protein
MSSIFEMRIYYFRLWEKLILSIFVQANLAKSYSQIVQYATKSFRATGKAFFIWQVAQTSPGTESRCFHELNVRRGRDTFPLQPKANDPRLRQAEGLKSIYPLGVGVDTFETSVRNPSP